MSAPMLQAKQNQHTTINLIYALNSVAHTQSVGNSHVWLDLYFYTVISANVSYFETTQLWITLCKARPAHHNKQPI